MGTKKGSKTGTRKALKFQRSSPFFAWVKSADSDVFSFELVGTLKSDCLAIGWINNHHALFAGVFGTLVIALEKP